MDQAKAGLLVDVTGGDQDAIGPQRDLPIAHLSGESKAFLHQAAPDAKTARLRLDVHQAQLGHLRGPFDEEYGSDDLALPLGDPAAFALGVKLRDEFRRDLCDQRFELLVPSILLTVEHSVTMND